MFKCFDLNCLNFTLPHEAPTSSGLLKRPGPMLEFIHGLAPLDNNNFIISVNTGLPFPIAKCNGNVIWNDCACYCNSYVLGIIFLKQWYTGDLVIRNPLMNVEKH